MWRWVCMQWCASASDIEWGRICMWQCVSVCANMDCQCLGVTYAFIRHTHTYMRARIHWHISRVISHNFYFFLYLLSNIFHANVLQIAVPVNSCAHVCMCVLDKCRHGRTDTHIHTKVNTEDTASGFFPSTYKQGSVQLLSPSLSLSLSSEGQVQGTQKQFL